MPPRSADAAFLLGDSIEGSWAILCMYCVFGYLKLFRTDNVNCIKVDLLLLMLRVFLKQLSFCSISESYH